MHQQCLRQEIRHTDREDRQSRAARIEVLHPEDNLRPKKQLEELSAALLVSQRRDKGWTTKKNDISVDLVLRCDFHKVTGHV